jgi:ubiquinone/menaquinone biosynthesis C-methylase UbiE
MIDCVSAKILNVLKLRNIKLYDSIAEEYASFDEQHPQHNLDMMRIERLISEKKPKFILDLGCGSGRYLPFLKGEIIVAVDLSRGMLRQAKKFKNANFIQADIYHLPFTENTFDMIISMSVIAEVVPFNMKLLKEIRKTLRFKGTFLFTAIPLHHLLFPHKNYLQFFLPFQVIQLILGKNHIPHLYASKLQIVSILRKLGLEIAKINERHGRVYPHFLVEGTKCSKENYEDG